MSAGGREGKEMKGTFHKKRGRESNKIAGLFCEDERNVKSRGLRKG